MKQDFNNLNKFMVKNNFIKFFITFFINFILSLLTFN